MATQKRKNDQQLALWDAPEPIMLAGILPEVPQANPEELRKLIEVRDGVTGILASKFAEWSGYVASHKFRQHIEQLMPELEALFGPINPISSMVRIGSGAWREVRDYFLPHLHLNHALIYTRLPQLRALRGLVTTVFTEHQSGGLISTNAETTIRIQDATVAAEEAAPGITRIGAELAAIQAAEEAKRARIAAEEAKFECIKNGKAIAELGGAGRRKPTRDAMRCSLYIVHHLCHDFCPCCHRIKILDGPGRKNKRAHWDHYFDHNKTGPQDGWYVCDECNKRFEDQKDSYKAEKRPAWDDYQGHVRWYFNPTTKLI